MLIANSTTIRGSHYLLHQVLFHRTDCFTTIRPVDYESNSKQIQWICATSY